MDIMVTKLVFQFISLCLYYCQYAQPLHELTENRKRFSSAVVQIPNVDTVAENRSLVNMAFRRLTFYGVKCVFSQEQNGEKHITACYNACRSIL